MLLWGDSMANSAFQAFDSFSFERNLTGTLITSPSCAPILHLARDVRSRQSCFAGRLYALETLATSEATEVFLFARWAYHAGGYSDDFNLLSGSVGFVDENGNPVQGDSFELFERGLRDLLRQIGPKHRVTIIGPAPETQQDVPRQMIKALRFGTEFPPLARETFEKRTRKTIELLKRISREEGVGYIDLTGYFCDASECRQQIDGVPIYADQVHLSPLGNAILLRALEDAAH